MSKKLELNSKQLQNFWAKVAKAGENECWLWTGATNSKNYGSFAINSSGVSAHKIAWALEYNDGILSDSNNHIMHSCDVRNCVNPKHLSIGTAKDNVKDAITKGRMVVRVPSKDELCKNGHPRNEENTHPKYNTCILCMRKSNAESKRRERERDREAYNKYHREYYQKVGYKPKGTK